MRRRSALDARFADGAHLETGARSRRPDDRRSKCGEIGQLHIARPSAVTERPPPAAAPPTTDGSRSRRGVPAAASSTRASLTHASRSATSPTISDAHTRSNARCGTAAVHASAQTRRVPRCRAPASAATDRRRRLTRARGGAAAADIGPTRCRRRAPAAAPADASERLDDLLLRRHQRVVRARRIGVRPECVGSAAAAAAAPTPPPSGQRAAPAPPVVGSPREMSPSQNPVVSGRWYGSAVQRAQLVRRGVHAQRVTPALTARSSARRAGVSRRSVDRRIERVEHPLEVADAPSDPAVDPRDVLAAAHHQLLATRRDAHSSSVSGNANPCRDASSIHRCRPSAPACRCRARFRSPD